MEKKCDNETLISVYKFSRRVTKLITGILLSFIILFVLVTGYKNIDPFNKGYENPDFLGIQAYSIGSESMYPKMKIGDIVIMKKVKENSDIRKNQIVAYRLDEDTIVIHRINKINSDGSYTTKGDNNPKPDGKNVSKEQILATKIVTIPKLQTIVLTIRKPLGFIALCLLMGGIFIIYDNLIKIPDEYFGYGKNKKNKKELIDNFI